MNASDAASAVAIDKAATRADASDAGAPPRRLRLKLKSMDDVKSELARLYRDGKAGRRDIADVSKLANVLSIIGRLIEGVELARRVEQLEEGAKK